MSFGVGLRFRYQRLAAPDEVLAGLWASRRCSRDSTWLHTPGNREYSIFYTSLPGAQGALPHVSVGMKVEHLSRWGIQCAGGLVACVRVREVPEKLTALATPVPPTHAEPEQTSGRKSRRR